MVGCVYWKERAISGATHTSVYLYRRINKEVTGVDGNGRRDTVMWE